MTDKTIKLGGSVLQHGKFNDRVYLMKLSDADFPAVIDKIFDLAKENGYTKVFAKVPKRAESGFIAAGYETEAVIPNFFTGAEDACFMSYYFDKNRKIHRNRREAEQIIHCAQSALPISEPLDLPDGFGCEILKPADAEETACVYRTVFETYPFPIFEPEYIRQTMVENIVYFGIRKQGTLAAVSSCEMDRDGQNVEMTDFATLPEHRSKGLALFLLSEMENEMKKRGVLTAYTIARSMSYGMNISFAKHQYTYCGTLINNTNISGSIESMNVWYKAI